MPRPVKNHKNVNVSLSTPVYERFRAYAEYMGQSYTVAMERIIGSYLDQQGFGLDPEREKDEPAGRKM